MEWHDPADDREHQAVYGVDRQSLAKLVELCDFAYTDLNGVSFDQMLADNPRGRDAKLRSIKDLICFTLIVLKSGITFDFAGYLVKFDRSRAHRQFTQGVQLLHFALDEENYLPTRFFDSPEDFKQYFNSSQPLIIDATEQRLQRPQDKEYQKEAYSGKKKLHTIKSMIISTLDRRIHYVSRAYVGSTHDYSLLKTEFDPSLNWFEGFQVRVDLGYTGFEKDYPGAVAFIPSKKPRKSELTEDQKIANRQLAKERIYVEHTIGGMKRYDILSNTARIHDVDLYDQVTGICAGIWNFFITR